MVCMCFLILTKAIQLSYISLNTVDFQKPATLGSGECRIFEGHNFV